MNSSWVPDTCPTGACEFDLDTGKAIRLCKTHQSLKDGGSSDVAILSAVKTKNREKNTLVNARALLLGVPAAKVQWSVNDKEEITVSDPLPDLGVGIR